MFSQSTNTKVASSCEVGLNTRVVECVDVEDPRDPVDDEDEQE